MIDSLTMLLIYDGVRAMSAERSLFARPEVVQTVGHITDPEQPVKNVRSHENYLLLDLRDIQIILNN